MIDLKHKNASALLWPIFFIGRRVIFAIGVLFLKEYSLFQIYLFMFSTLAVLMMVGLAKPLATPFENKQELYNNSSILVLIYALLCFTLFVPAPETRYNMGYAMILLTIQNIVISLIIIGVSPVRQLKLRAKKWCLMRAWRKRNGIKINLKLGLSRQSTKRFFKN